MSGAERQGLPWLEVRRDDCGDPVAAMERVDKPFSTVTSTPRPGAGSGAGGFCGSSRRSLRSASVTRNFSSSKTAATT